MLYVAMDIGCIECGEESAVLGIFSSREQAEAVCMEHEKRQKAAWHGQHEFEIFAVPAVDVETRQEYA